ncbi:MAG: hypothetical protein JWM00_681 [Candidatus Saccharibacteria bacterium]|nr:hypothetical protein [Candidatus Saccharibacteria bacterium]
MQETKSPNKALIAIIIIVLLAAVAAGVVYIVDTQNEGESTPSVSSSTGSAIAGGGQASTATSTGSYNNGTYTASDDYSTPEGLESITLTVAISGNTITSASIESSGNSRESRQYQAIFTDNFKSLVVGKDIDTVHLSRVAGSSLTSNGFNTALDQIKNDAAA